MASNHLGDSGINLTTRYGYHGPSLELVSLDSRWPSNLPVQDQEEHGRQRDAPLQQPPSPAYVRDAGDYDVAHRHREQIQHAGDRQPLAADQFHACKRKNCQKCVKKKSTEYL